MVALREAIRTERDAIVARWTEAIRDVAAANQLTYAALVDHIPALLDDIADALDRGDGDVRGAPEKHALDRLEAGFDVAQVVRELAELRSCVFARCVDDVLDLAEVRQFDQV